VVLGFLNSPEYQAGHISDAAYVNDLYFDVLGRSAEATGLASWEGVFKSGASRSAVARDFIDSPESQRRIVDGYYAALLHRAGEDAGVANWLSHLQDDLSPKSIGVAFLASTEYLANARAHVRP
jgi:hypothetical protein